MSPHAGRRDRQFHGKFPAVAAQGRGLDAPVQDRPDAGGQEGLQPPLVGLAVLRGNQEGGEPAPEDFRRGPAEEDLGLRVPARDPAVGVHGDHGVVGSIDQHPRAFLALPQVPLQSSHFFPAPAQLRLRQLQAVGAFTSRALVPGEQFPQRGHFRPAADPRSPDWLRRSHPRVLSRQVPVPVGDAGFRFVSAQAVPAVQRPQFQGAGGLPAGDRPRLVRNTPPPRPAGRGRAPPAAISNSPLETVQLGREPAFAPGAGQGQPLGGGRQCFLDLAGGGPDFGEHGKDLRPEDFHARGPGGSQALVNGVEASGGFPQGSHGPAAPDRGQRLVERHALFPAKGDDVLRPVPRLGGLPTELVDVGPKEMGVGQGQRVGRPAGSSQRVIDGLQRGVRITQ